MAITTIRILRSDGQPIAFTVGDPPASLPPIPRKAVYIEVGLEAITITHTKDFATYTVIPLTSVLEFTATEDTTGDDER